MSPGLYKSICVRNQHQSLYEQVLGKGDSKRAVCYLQEIIMQPERMDVDQSPYSSVIAYDGTRIYPLGKDVFFGVQWFNNGLSYVIRVSHGVSIFISN